jgi:hypothetical protein
LNQMEIYVEKRAFHKWCKFIIKNISNPSYLLKGPSHDSYQ